MKHLPIILILIICLIATSGCIGDNQSKYTNREQPRMVSEYYHVVDIFVFKGLGPLPDANVTITPISPTSSYETQSKTTDDSGNVFFSVSNEIIKYNVSVEYQGQQKSSQMYLEQSSYFMNMNVYDTFQPINMSTPTLTVSPNTIHCEGGSTFC
jgi:hypothetical protein